MGGKRERGGLVFRKIDHLKKRTQEKKNYATQKLQIYFKKLKSAQRKRFKVQYRGPEKDPIFPRKV